MMILIISILASVILATYLSALNLALISLSRAALQRKLNDKGDPAAGDWLHDQRDDAALATALLRTLARMTIYILTLAAVIDLHVEATVVWRDLIVSGLISAAIIWLSTIVLGSALARHCGVSMIVSSLPLLHAVTWFLKPATQAGVLVDRAFRRMIGVRKQEDAEEDFLQSIEDSQREGGIDIQSAEILENVVEFTNTETSQVMTPRTEIEGIEYTDDFDKIRAFIRHAMHSRIPVYKGNVDNIVGILYLKDLIHHLGEEVNGFKLAPLLRQPIVVPETKPVRELLSVFQHGEVHMAIVIDEYGSTAGLVTIEDVLEEIVGDIRDEHEPIEEAGAEFKLIDLNHAEVDGRYRIDDLNEQMPLNLPEHGDYDTVAGFVLAHFGHVPSSGEGFDHGNARFTVLDATPTQIRRIGIEIRLPTPDASAEREQEQTQAVK